MDDHYAWFRNADTLGDCGSQGSAEKQDQENVCVYIYEEIYCKGLAHVITGASKSQALQGQSANWRPRGDSDFSFES